MLGADEEISAADAPTIVELSADDVLRARTDAVANAGLGRKAEHLLEVRGLSTHFFTPDGVVQAVDDVTGCRDDFGHVGLAGDVASNDRDIEVRVLFGELPEPRL